MNLPTESQRPVPTWKGPSRRDRSPLDADRSSDKWVATVVVLLLIGSLVYAVWRLLPGRPGKIVWAVYAIGARQGPTDDSAEDGSFVQTLTDVLTSDEQDQVNSVVDWSSLEISPAGVIERGISQLLKKLKNQEDKDLILRKEDTFVLYLAGTGFTLKGEARIKLSDARVDDIATKSFALAGLLAEFKSCPAGTKLLILDLDAPGFDPRVGVVFNEFPHCAAQAIAAADSDVWVLLSHRDFEIPGEYASHRPTLLLTLVANALHGQAVPESRYLELRDLYRYVTTQCRTQFARHPVEGQLPVLMKTGRAGEVELSAVDESGLKLAMLTTASEEKPAGAATVGDKLEKKAAQKLKSGASKVESQLKSKVLQRARLPQIAGRYVAQLPGPAAKRNETTTKKSSTSKTDQPPTTDPSGTAADESAKQPKAAPDSPAADEAAGAKKVPDGEADAKKVDAVPAADAEDISPESKMQAALAEMWTAWYELHDPDRQFWAPIDACPLAWRALQRELLERARDWRRQNDPAEVANLAQEIADDLKRLRTYVQTYVQGASGRPNFGSRWLSTFFDDVAQAYSQASWPGVGAVTDDSYKQRDEAIRTYNGAMFLLTDLASWHALTSLGKVGATAPFEQITGKLTAVVEDVSALHKALAGLDEQLLERPAELRRPTDKLKNSLSALRTEIEQDVDRAIDWNDLAGERRIASLLDSPLPVARQRDALLSQWLARKNTAPTVVAASDADTSAQLDVTVPAARQWERVEKLIKIQATIIGLFDEGATEILGTLSKEAAAVADDDGKRQAYRKVATALGKFYGGLRQRIEAGPKSVGAGDQAASAAPNREATQQVFGLLRLVDARDINRNMAAESYGVWNEFDIRVKTLEPKLEFVSELREVTLELEPPLETTIPFRAVAVMQGVTAAVRCEPANTVAITRREGDQDIDCQEGVPFAVPINVSAAENQQLRLALRALREQAPEAEGPVKVMVTLAAQGTVHLPATECRILCQLPKPDRIELIARKTGSLTSEPPSPVDDIVCLRSFPNRTTAYELYLTNRADRSKSVSVRLFKLPPVRGQTWAPGRLRSHDNRLAPDILQAVFVNGNPDEGILENFAQQHLLAEVDEITIQPGNRETPLSFLPRPKEGEEAKPSTEAETKKAAPPGEIDISYGMLCWITDKGGSGRSWAKWIELPVLHPREYVSVLPPAFRGGQITVEVELNKSAGFSWSDKEPVRVTWTGVASIDLSDKIPKELLKKGDLPADGQQERVFLAVDDYPRAFVLDVPRQSTEEASDPASWEGRFASIRVERVTAQFPKPDEPDVPRPPDDVRLINGLRETIAFKPCEKLLIDMAADVPTRTFTADYDPTQAIRLTVDGQQKAGPYFADRDAKTFLVDCSERLTLKAQVTDYRVALFPGGQDTSIAVEASVPRQEAAVDPARLTIQVDGQSPRVTSDRRSYAIDLGQPLSIQLNLEDTLSGIDRVLYGIVDPDKVDEAKLKSQELINCPKREQITLRLPTADAGLEKGKPFAVAVIAYDRAGNKTRDTLELSVHEPAPPKPVGDIVGTVDYNGASLDSWTLQIVGPGVSEQVEHGAKGQKFSFQAKKDAKSSEYRFKDLNPGTYTITVEGTPTGRTLKSKPIQVTVEAGKESKAVPITEFE